MLAIHIGQDFLVTKFHLPAIEVGEEVGRLMVVEDCCSLIAGLVVL